MQQQNNASTPITISPITISPSAIKHLKHNLLKHPNATGIRIGVKDSGCSGKEYFIEFTENIETASIPDNPMKTCNNVATAAKMMTAATANSSTTTNSVEDVVLEIDNIKIVVDGASIAYLQETRLDCVKEGVNETLKFLNPNAINVCGCGESFQVKQVKDD